MKKFLIILLIICFHYSRGQSPGEWVWLSGDSITNNPGTFGLQGIPNSTNCPPSLYESCEWTDLNGNFWLWGGRNLIGGYSDLWRFNPNTNEWTWMKGPGIMNDPGNYGIKGIPSASNNPPFGFVPVSWVDLNGDFWMFGGGYNTVAADLWKYEIATNEWTWMKGPGTPNYPGSFGSIGIPDPANNPPGIEETAASWTDNAGDLWLFGGSLIPITDKLNTVWRYTVSTNIWTWVKGSQFPNQAGIYGIIGVEGVANTPGSRFVYSKWKDNNGNFWLFGGQEPGLKNDLWRFNPITTNWTWMNGSSGSPLFDVYGTKCIPHVLNTPIWTEETRAVWTDVNGDFWFRCRGYPIVNSMWKYCVAQNEWCFINGDSVNTTGVWGTKGISSPSNIPPSTRGSIGWADKNGNLYFFGGVGLYSWFNSLWKYTIDPCCAMCVPGIPSIGFAVSDICPGTCLDISNTSQSYSLYEWLLPGATPSYSNFLNPQNICYSVPGNYSITLIASGCNVLDTLTQNIVVFPSPGPQSITQSADTLFSVPGSSFYQWYLNGTVINGATNYFYVASSSGDYNVVATDSNGCEVEAVIYNVIADVPTTVDRGLLTIFPNPVRHELRIKNEVPIAIGIKIETARISIYNVVGQEVFRVADYKMPTVDCRQLPPGIYILELNSGSKMMRTRFVKE